MAKRHLKTWLNSGLLDRLNAERFSQGRTQNAIVEQALAEYLNVPLADRDLPEQPVELCAACERAVLNNGRCRECGWHRDPRRARDVAARARVEPGSKYPNEEAA